MGHLRDIVANTKNDKVTDDGGIFLLSHTYTAVASAQTVYIRHVTGNTKHLHSIIQIETVGQWKFTSYAETVYTEQGTLIEKIKRRSDSTVNLESNFYHTPTIDSIGTARLNFTFGTGTLPSRVNTGQMSESYKSVFEPNADVLICLENQSAATAYISFIFNVFEEKLN